ncbi:IPT/TIG domain-containing protein [Terrimonas sp. NA20]|uniref:IPT/TIG domain-containing protein n=1 Tax=Terrimonas ginsenosidimutans TaxID=2908004 RepID=A0ABS9L0A1_9BACT|nr:IPT/TIG domain-containing protein [Terrimonas ginsenosidimutans]MCG2618001.1 IPT/TIG domain-containing protein [Terrimonas ginsenosidimutans]
MQKILAVAAMVILFSCSKPDNQDPDPTPGGGGGQNQSLKINEVSPGDVNPNTVMIIINGSGFGSKVEDNEVLFGTVPAIIRTAAITQLVTEVPLALVDGPYDVSVKANGRSATKTGAFRYSAGDLEIVTVTPASAFPGTTSITLNGRGFGRIPANNQVKIGTMVAVVKTAVANQLVVDLPANIKTGTYDVTVTANGKTFTKEKALIYDQTVVTTFAGSGTGGSADGMGTQAQFLQPLGIAVDADRNLYVTDLNRIRKITPAGQVTTYAGSGIKGSADGQANTARFDMPSSIAIDQAGTLYVADQFNHSIRKISTNGIVSTIAGNSTAGSNNGTGTAASFALPYGVAVNPAGTVLYVGDNGNNKIRKINLVTNEVSDYAGDGTNSSKDGELLKAGIPSPGGLHLAADGTLYVTEKGAGKTRRISTGGFVSTIGGILSVNTAPCQIVVDQEETAYVVFKRNNHIKKYTKAGVESVIFGGNNSGDTEGPASQALFFTPEGIAMIEENDGTKTFYISDTGNRKIKKIVLSK